MKKHLLLTAALFILCLYNTAHAQKVSFLFGKDTVHVPSYAKAVSLPGRSQLLLETGFNNGIFLSPQKLDSLNGKVIEKVELVYTHYWTGNTFRQDLLNAQRISALKKTAPFIFDQPLTEWSLVAQHSATAEEARKQFHGFVITYRDEPTAASMKEEIDFIKDMLEGKKIAAEDISKKDTSAGSEKETGKDIIVPVIATSSFLYSWTLASNGNYIWTVEKEDTILQKALLKQGGEITGSARDHDMFSHGKKEVYFIKIRKLPGVTYFDDADVVKAPSSGYITYSWKIDSTVTAVLDRKKNEWKDMLVLGDLTGSMAPYSSQLFMWYKMNMMTKPVKYFVFFNDGDMKGWNEKHPGSTGGLYYTSGATFEEVMSTAQQTMTNGSGGDLPENNVEAAIAGLEKCSDCDAVIMIADNWATPRDLELAYKIKKPLKIILCGASRGINIEYLNLARATGGSVHLMEQDLESLASMLEGETITVRNITYQLRSGKLVAVKQM